MQTGNVSVPMQEYVKPCLIDLNLLYETLDEAITHYLSTTQFGALSLWRHGSSGRNFATAAQQWLREHRSEPRSVLLLAATLCHCTAWTLRRQTQQKLAFSGLLRESLFAEMQRLSSYTPEAAFDEAVCASLAQLSSGYGIQAGERSLLLDRLRGGEPVIDLNAHK